MFCREQVARYGARKAEVEGLGASIVAIGNGTALMARDFVERFGIEFEVYTDPSRRSYRAAGLRRGLSLRPSMVGSAWRAMKSGHFQGRTRGDPTQLGGTLVVDADGSVVFSHVDTEAGDHADIDRVIAALRDA